MKTNGLGHLDNAPVGRSNLNDQALNKQHFCILNDDFFAFFAEKASKEAERKEKARLEGMNKKRKGESNGDDAPGESAAKRPKTTKCSNTACISKFTCDINEARKANWKSCGEKRCRQIYCPKAECEGIRVRHKVVCKSSV
jgi:hypothetical protein